MNIGYRHGYRILAPLLHLFENKVDTINLVPFNIQTFPLTIWYLAKMLHLIVVIRFQICIFDILNTAHFEMYYLNPYWSQY